MNDEIIVLSDVCHSLTDDKIIRQKLHDDYSYQLRKPESNLCRGLKLVNKAKPKKTKSSQMEQNQQMVEVITVKADEFYPWVVKQISDKKLPEAIRSNIPKKYTTHYVEVAPNHSTSGGYMYGCIVQYFNNPTPEQLQITKLSEQLNTSIQQVFDLKDKINELEARLAKAEKELAEAKPKAEKWDNWNNKKRKH